MMKNKLLLLFIDTFNNKEKIVFISLHTFIKLYRYGRLFVEFNNETPKHNSANKFKSNKFLK